MKTRREFIKQGSLGGSLIAGSPLLRPAADFLRPQVASSLPDGLLAWWKAGPAQDDDPGGRAGELADRAGGLSDPILGNFRYGQAPSGGLKLDGFSTVVTREAARAPRLTSAFTVEARLALAAFPWNWCAIVAQQRAEEAGFFFGVGPRGEIGLHMRNRDGWVECTSDDFVLTHEAWAHVAATFDPSSGIVVYLDGEPVAEVEAVGQPTFARDVEMILGTNHEALLPSHIHREEGTLPSWWSLDGYLDDVKIWDRALTASEVSAAYTAQRDRPDPAFAPRRLPSGPPGPGRFGAYFTKLEYYEEWDALWPVGSHADVIVRFDQTAARMVFWRGTRYSPAWVSENGLWMAEQSVEAWDPSTYEHMNDFHCRYSHVRVIENTDARVVIHWRYAPVNVHDRLWRVDERTGWGCWIDEYYAVYPDAMATRTVSWRTGSLGRPRQFQESIPLCHPKQMRRDVVATDFVTVANLRGESQVLSYVEDPAEQKEGLPDDLTIQMHNFRSSNKPFIVFEPGNRMEYTRDLDIERLSRHGSSSHWPVGQILSDGRSAQSSDRATSFLGFPISSPPLHEGDDGHTYWTGLYGMTEMTMPGLVGVARSWTRPAEISVGGGYVSAGFERRERAYVVRAERDETRGAGPGAPAVATRAEAPASLRIDLSGDAESPVFHPAFIVEGWGDLDAALSIDGRDARRGEDYRIGHRHGLASSDLLVWVNVETDGPVRLVLAPS